MDDQRYIFYSDIFPKHVDVPWESVLMYVNATLNDPTGHCHVISDGGPPSYMSKWRRGYPCPPLFTIARREFEAWSGHECQNMDVYVSYFAPADTFGRHKDEEDVLIIGVKGRTSYRFDTNACETCMADIVTVNPGDALYIPKGMYHEASPKSPRAIFSYRVDAKT